jgi:hypothetical protein
MTGDASAPTKKTLLIRLFKEFALNLGVVALRSLVLVRKVLVLPRMEEVEALWCAPEEREMGGAGEEDFDAAEA